MSKRVSLALMCGALTVLGTASAAQEPTDKAADYRADALSFAPLVNERYAYLDRLGGHFDLPPALQHEAEAVHDDKSLLKFLERGVALLADHHAITGSSFNDSWAIVPSYSDMWVEEKDGTYTITSIRSASPAEGVVKPGDKLIQVAGVPMAQAVTAFWHDLGLDAPDAVHRAYAARVLLAGRRDRERAFTVQRGAKQLPLTLPSLYAVRKNDRPPVTVTHDGPAWRVRFNDSIGDDATIPAFDAAMAQIPDAAPVILDLTDTASGGNSSIARAVIGWFIDRPRPYQVHSSPEEERATGVPRMWVEYVIPRAGKHHSGPATVLADRWTGSMGEGMAIGFDAMGVPVCGTAMAGLVGAVDDNRLEHSGQVVKLPTERLTTVAGLPREQFQPKSLSDPACATIASDKKAR
uniref:S41 family peptidase n=1 Tax=Altererythrobacter segetis TaxID=1104773 RepID=UPI00140C209A|nr:S41 family peptidase [Altererythrobacter segetis]